MRLAYGHASRAVLLGSSAGDELRRATITQHLEALKTVLVDDMRWGLVPANCLVLVDPARQNEVDLALRSAGEGVGSGGSLLVFYVGPILLGQDGTLSLVLPGTDIRDLDGTAVRYDRLRWRVRENGALHRVVVLDCYDLAAMPGHGSAEAVARAAAIERTSVTVHVSGEPAPAYPGFTAELVELLARGLPRGPNLMDLATVHRVVGERLAAAGAPAPVLLADGQGDTVPLVRNAALYRKDRQGQVLYGTDAAAETDLARAVILVLRYDKDDGALGVILNRPGTEPADPLMLTGKAALSAPAVVFAGGPVRHEGYVLLVLLREAATVPVRFRPVVGLLGTVPLSATLSEESVALARLFRGYVGWGPGELEADLAGEVLVPTGAPVDVAFTDTPDNLWRRLRATG